MVGKKQGSFRAPLIVSLLASFLMLASLGLQQYSVMQYATASIMTKVMLGTEITMGGLGIFALVYTFPMLISMILRSSKSKPAASGAHSKEDVLPYQSLNSKTRALQQVVARILYFAHLYFD
jgi:hypothetical protein